MSEGTLPHVETSEHSLSSWWVDNEISTAFAKEQQIMRERGKKVLALIPSNLDGYLFKWTNGKAKQVLTRLAADFTDWHRDTLEFEGQIERIVSALRTDEGEVGQSTVKSRASIGLSRALRIESLLTPHGTVARLGCWVPPEENTLLRSLMSKPQIIC